VAEGKLISEYCTQTQAFRSKEAIVDDIINGIRQVMDPDVIGIGIGVPGLVDEKQGIVYDLTNIPSWNEVHLKKYVQQAFGRTVSISNDANCFALGEKMYGKGKRYRNMVGITLGTGVGAGIILNDQLCPGNLSIAGEFSSIPYLSHDYEYYCSGKFFSNVYGITGKELYERAHLADAKAIKIFDEYGMHLGNLLKIILLTIGPEAIILGGSGAGSFRFFQKAMMESIYNFPFKRVLNNLIIEVSHNEKIALFGAAALVLSELELCKNNP
jgi:glucokinase